MITVSEFALFISMFIFASATLSYGLQTTTKSTTSASALRSVDLQLHNGKLFQLYAG